MAPRLPTPWSVLIAAALTVACEPAATPPTSPPRRRAPARPAPVDARAPAPVDAPAPADAPTPTAAADAGAPRSTLDLFVVGGADLMRPGAVVTLRAERGAPNSPGVVDVTRTATFRVVPATVGRVDPGGAFHALALGRAEIVAALGTDEARTIVEVSAELPPGMTTVPVLQVSDGRAAHSIHFGALPDGTVMLDVQFTGQSIALRGRRTGNTFPMTIPVRESLRPATGDLRDAGAGPPPAVGTLVLDRWADRRLDGRATLQVAGRPLRLRFSMLFADASPLRQRVGP